MEKMFYVRALEESSAGEPAASEAEVAARLSFHGRPSGSLTLRLTAGPARSITADFLGCEEGELTEAQVGEVICELANIICGSVLSRMGNDAHFRLSTPQLVQEPEPEGIGASPPASAQHAMKFGSGALAVTM